jgi:hypothetical protein
VPVEAALGQAGRAHDAGNPGLCQAVGKEHAGGREDALARLFGVLPALLHGINSLCENFLAEVRVQL